MKITPFQHSINLLKAIIIIKLRSRHFRREITDFACKWLAREKIPNCCQRPQIIWLGQSTFLIQLNGKNILTDPLLFNPSMFFPRVIPLGITLENLPKIDIVLISHNHRDHLDKKSLRFIRKYNPEILAPAGTRNLFKTTDKITEFELWQEKLIEEWKIKFTFLPAYHWSGRNPFDINKTPAGSWMIEFDNKKIYFAGDSAYSGHFAEIGEKFKKIDVAIIPISPVKPEKLMSKTHISGEESIQSFIDLEAHTFISSHWGTFIIGCEPLEEPIDRIVSSWKRNKRRLLNKKLELIKAGQILKI